MTPTAGACAGESDMATKYYLLKLLGHTEPSGMCRFFDEPTRPPEYFKKGEGWVPKNSLYARIASGEIDDEDQISETEAKRLAVQWGGTI